MSRVRLTKEEVHRRIHQKHGGRIRMTTEYVTSQVQAAFACICSHVWQTTPMSVMSGNGCEMCARSVRGLKRRVTEEEFQRRLRDRFEGRIKATEPYSGMDVKIWFVCDKNHAFLTSPHSLLNDEVKLGCKTCGYESMTKSQTNTLDEVMSQVRCKHGEVFRLVGEYSGRKIRTDWECHKGHQLFSSLENILITGCKRCRGRVNNHEEYVDELRVRFGGKVWALEKYRFSRVDILHACINGHEFMRILHGCGICGNEWMVSPSSVVHQESGCGECAEYGFKMSLPAFLYYLRVIERATGNHYFKIGITNRGVELRIGQMVRESVSIDAISVTSFATGREAHALEQRILKECSIHRAKGIRILKNGNSELFTKDILETLAFVL